MDINTTTFRCVAKLEKYDRTLFEDLSREKKAIQNWQRLKVLIAIMSLVKGTIDEGTAENKTMIIKPKKTLDYHLAKVISSPDTRAKRIWFVFASVFYLIGFF